MRDIEKVLEMYIASAKAAAKGLVGNLLILPLSIALFILMMVATNLVAPFGMAGGFILGFLQIAALSYFYSWITAILDREKITFNSCYEFDAGLFSGLISVAFIFFIVGYLVQSMIQGLELRYIMLFLNLGIVFVFNAVPEVIVVSRQEGTSALLSALEFARDNFIAWFIPLVIMVAPLLALSPSDALVLFAQSEPLLPATLIFTSLATAIGGTMMYYAAILVAIAAAIWGTLFRMFLYRALS